jgi:hypothetical protein
MPDKFSDLDALRPFKDLLRDTGGPRGLGDFDRPRGLGDFDRPRDNSDDFMGFFRLPVTIPFGEILELDFLEMLLLEAGFLLPLLSLIAFPDLLSPATLLVSACIFMSISREGLAGEDLLPPPLGVLGVALEAARLLLLRRGFFSNDAEDFKGFLLNAWSPEKSILSLDLLRFGLALFVTGRTFFGGASSSTGFILVKRPIVLRLILCYC